LAILYQVIRIAIELMEWLIIARVLLSWVNVGPNNQIAAFIYEMTEPILKPIRSAMPRGSIPLDFSPVIAIILLEFLQRFILSVLF
jgi:YggT family protein